MPNRSLFPPLASRVNKGPWGLPHPIQLSSKVSKIPPNLRLSCLKWPVHEFRCYPIESSMRSIDLSVVLCFMKHSCKSELQINASSQSKSRATFQYHLCIQVIQQLMLWRAPMPFDESQSLQKCCDWYDDLVFLASSSVIASPTCSTAVLMCCFFQFDHDWLNIM